MRPIESKFKIWEEEVNQHNYFNKLVDERAFFEVFPDVVDYEMLDPVNRQIASYARGNIIGPDGTLMDIFESNARVVKTNSRYIRWKLFTNDGDIRASFVKNFEANNNYPGKGHSTFYLGLDSDWFGPNDVIIFEGLREIPLLVRDNPEPIGNIWRYEVVLLDDKPTAYFSFGDLDLGTRAIQIGSLIGEATVSRGNVHFGDGEAFVEFEVPMTRMGWEMKVTDNAHLASKNFRLSPESTDGSKGELSEDILYNTLDMKFMREVNRQKDLWLTYGRAAGRFAGKFLDGVTERQLITGPSLIEFLESSYQYDYNIEGGSIDIFREKLPPLWHDKVEPENRVVDIYTGTGGLLLWQKWCKKADVDGVLQTADLHYGDEEAFFPGRKGVSIGKKQYRAAYIEPFGLVRVHYLPFLDSEQIETRKYKGLPITSYEFLVFNFGYGDGRDSNIYILENEDVRQFGYSIGTWSPVGPVLGNARAHNRFFNGEGHENAYRIIHECMFGIVVKDPSYMIWFKPNLC